MPEKLLPPGVSIATASEALSLFPSMVLNVGNLDRLKRGDFVRIVLKFTETREGAEPNPRSTEFLTGIVMSKASGLIRVKAYSRPEKTRFHAVDYGDELVVNDFQIVTHEMSTDQIAKDVEPFLTNTVPDAVPVNSEDAKIRDAVKNLPPLAPERGREYWTRNGSLVKVWTYKEYGTTSCARCGRQLIGSNIQNEQCPNAPGQLHAWQNQQRAVWIGGTADGAEIEWKPDGSHAGGLRDLDIVKDPKMNEVLA